MVLRLNGYGAWIESEDKPLAEHAVEVKDDDIYICSEEGKVSGRRWITSSLPWNPDRPLTSPIHQEFILHFDDDGSHLTTPSTPYGRSLKITIDGLGVDNLWSDPRRKQSSHEVSVGDTVRPYVLAPIDTTGLPIPLSPQ